MRFKLIFAITLTLSLSVSAQKKIIGFCGSWYGENTYNNQWGIQYHKMTDVVFAFMLPNADGSVSYGMSEVTWNARLSAVKHFARLYGTKVHFSAGGWTASNYLSGGRRDPDPVREMVLNPTARALFVQKVMATIEEHDLDGFNMDWEYPEPSDNLELKDLLKELRAGIMELEERMNKDIELSIAVASGSYGSEAYGGNLYKYVDYVYVMAFDNNSATNHSTVDFGKDALDFWKEIKGVTEEKLILGIPFYSGGSNASSGSYVNFSASDPAGYYSDPDGNYGNYHYNSAPMIQEKLAYVDEIGGSGAFVWECTQDRKDQYSLLSVMYQHYYPEADLTLSTEEVSENLFSVYPTFLTSGQNAIQVVNNNIWTNQVQYQVFDITGNVISMGELTANNASIPMASTLSNGLYFVQLRYGTKSQTLKIVKK